MSALQVSVVLIRLFAIWCAIDAIAWFLDLWTPYSNARYGTAITLAYAIVYALVAVALWKFPALIARRMLGEAISPSPPATDPKALLNVAVIAIGLLLL